MIRRVLPALIACALLLAPVAADATIAVKLDIDALSTTSDTIVLGQVESKRSQWEGTRIVTDYTVKVTLPVAGAMNLGDKVSVRTLGGRVDDLAQRVYGTAGFAVGEDVLLFLETRADTKRVVGMAQGRFKIQRDADGVVWAGQELNGLGLAEVVGTEGGKLATRMLDHPEAMKLSLSSLLQQIGVSLAKVGTPLRPEVTERLGANFQKKYDFKVELGGVRQ